MNRVLRTNKSRKWTVSMLSTIVVLLVFALGFVFGRSGFNVAWEDGNFKYEFKGSLYPENKEIDFDLFWNVWKKMENMYVEKDMDEEKMFYGAIKGMVMSVGDPATYFLTAEETEQYEVERSGKFEGVGIELGYMDNQVVIKRVFDNSPARRGGVMKGDVITAVDNEDVDDWSISDVAKHIRGEQETQVQLTVLRGQENIPIDLIRAEVYVASIRWEVLDNDTALITVRRFTEDNFADFVMLWDQTIDEVLNEDPEGIIIDLRGNGGGYLDGATYLAGEFLKKGDSVLYVQDRAGKQEVQQVEREGKLQNIPVILLVDAGTASSAEIFTGALQYYDRVLVIGEDTFGKGTAQDIVKPASWGGASVHITTQKWLLPDKRWINHDDSIHPDIVIEVSIEQIRLGEDLQLGKAKEEILKMFD